VLIDRHLPGYEFVERHEAFIPASPQRVLAAVRSLQADQIRLAAPLFFIRSLPGLVRRAGRRSPSRLLGTDRPFLEAFIPLEMGGAELVYGLAGRFWEIGGGTARPRGAHEFARLSDPTLAVAVANFVAEPVPGGTRLSTETRVHVEDPSSRAKFTWYWRVIRPGSGLLRRSMLAAVRRAATSSVR